MKHVKVLAPAVVAALLVAGCASDEPEPDPDPGSNDDPISTVDEGVETDVDGYDTDVEQVDTDSGISDDE